MPGNLGIPEDDVVPRIPADRERTVGLQAVAFLRPVEADEEYLGHSCRILQEVVPREASGGGAGPPDLGDQLVDGDGFGHPALDPPIEAVRGRLAADDDDGNEGCLLLAAKAGEDLAPIHEGHEPVEENDVGLLASGDAFDGFSPVRGQLDLETALVESDCVETAGVRIVLHDENLGS